MDNQEMLNQMREFVGPKGDRWVLDESLRDRAEALVEKFSEDLGHISLPRVVFVRAIGVSSAKWLGECAYVGSKSKPTIARHILASLAEEGMIDAEYILKKRPDLLNPLYIITLNDSAIRAKVGAGDEAEKLVEVLETVTLYHELLHIKPGMDGNIGHDVQDFAKVLHRFGVFWTEGVIGPQGVGLEPDAALSYVQDLNNLNLDPSNFPEGESAEE